MQTDPGSNLSRSPLLRRLKIVFLVLAFIAAAGIVGIEYAIHHAQPILRARVIQTLSTRFDSHVQLGEFDVSVSKGLQVEGKNLSLRSNLDPDLPPQISVGQFRFHTGILDLFRSPMHITAVQVSGLKIQIPPKGERSAMPRRKKNGGKLKIIIDRVVCDNAVLTILTNDPGKTPLQFKIHALTLQRVGSDKPLHFVAQLVNPKPIGDIAAEGDFGPWNADRPHDTPVEGKYSFTNADLSTTKGITGILSSQGKFSGQLDTITVDGETDTPNFTVDVSGHPVALHTDFHAIVNGTNGNTYLQPVHAHFLHTHLTATGRVVHAQQGSGHDIYLDVRIDHGRVQDLLQMGAKTTPPVMKGALHLKTHFELPAGSNSVSHRIRLRGTFAIDNMTLANQHIQKSVDEMSLRSQGHAREAQQLAAEEVSASNPLPKVPASMHGVFSLANRKLTLPQLVCNIPGAEIALAGTYTLDGKQFNFTGRARMDAHISSMVGGWKGALLRPADRFFSKDGVGTSVPIQITGTQSKPHFGLNYKR